jgi:hypothetical protein
MSVVGQPVSSLLSAFLPIPLSMAAATVASLQLEAQGKDFADQAHFWNRMAIEGGIALGCLVAMRVLRHAYQTPVSTWKANLETLD